VFHLFGRPGVQVGKLIARELPAKAYLAFAYLSSTPDHLVRRSSLASWLWENSTTKQAFANLRQLLGKIRRFEQKHHVDILEEDRSFLSLAKGAQVDLTDFHSTKIITNFPELTQYMARFSEGFLSELGDMPGEELQGWVSDLQQRYCDRFIRISCSFLLSHNCKESIQTLETLFAHYPAKETVVKALISQYANNNDSDAIQRTFLFFESHLQKEFGVSPSPNLINLVARTAPVLISDLANRYGYLSNHQNSLAVEVEQSLPRLIVLPVKTKAYNPRGSDNDVAKKVVSDLVQNLHQLRSFELVSPGNVQGNSSTNQIPLSADFLLSAQVKARCIEFTLVTTASADILLAQCCHLDVTPGQNGDSFVSQTIANAIKSSIDAAVIAPSNLTRKWQAYRTYLQAKNSLVFGNLPSVRSTRRQARNALNNMPELFLARQLLAHTNYVEWFLLGRQDKALLVEAQRHAVQLIKSDPAGAGGYWEHSITLLYLGRSEDALSNIDRALRFDPNNTDMLAHKSDVLCHLGHKNKALPFINQALHLNPVPPTEYYWIRAGILFLQKKYNEALEDSLHNGVNTPLNWRIVAACYAMLGNNRAARHARNAHLEEYPDFRLSEWKKSFPLQKNDLNHYSKALLKAGFC